MAAVTKGTRPSMATLVPGDEHLISGYLAGEAIEAGDMCYRKAADGLIWRCTGAAANEAAIPWGMALDDCVAGDAVTLAHGVKMGYKPLVSSTPVAVNAVLYIGVNGKFDSAATTGDAVGSARVFDTDGMIFVKTRL